MSTTLDLVTLLNMTNADPHHGIAWQPGDPVRVLVVEDHRMFAEALAKSLADQQDIEILGISTNLEHMRQFLRRQRADVVLVDYQLPDGDGLVGAQQIRRDHPNTRVLLVTATEDRNLLEHALAVGCSGYLSKQESLIHLPAAIRSAMVGSTVISPSLVAKLLAKPQSRGGADELTERETEILQLLANGWETGQIAERLFMSTSTLRNHLSRLNTKLGTHSRLGAVSKAMRLGLLSVDAADGPPDDTSDGH